ncbi:MAG: Zn-ribbon domain-containing OB-fold protein [Actinomycetota bacterium]
MAATATNGSGGDDAEEPYTKLPPAELIALTPDVFTAPFWAAAAEHRLVVPRCTSCGTYRFPPSAFCYACRAQDVEWVEQSGRGTLYSYTVIRHPILPEVSDSVPYIPAVVELPDTGGVRLVANLVDVRPSEVRFGMDLLLVWRNVADGVTVPTFRPA